MSQPKEIGTLVVVVLKAQHLHQPSFYKQDPYAQASLSGLTKRTKVDPKGGQHPVWDDELRFPVFADAGKDKVNRVLEIACYKDEQRGEDVLLGKGTVDIEETLKNGEFDDWVQLETSAGARGEVYLEMTFYANSPPPLTRRPSKLKPSDRVARPAAYFTQGRQLQPIPASTPSPQPARSPATGERGPSQPQAGVNRIPSSLIPARGPKGQASRQVPPNPGASSVFPSKHDSLPPLPIDSDLADVGTGKSQDRPSTLYPGGRGGPRPMPPHSGDRVMNTIRSPSEIFPEHPHRMTSSDTRALRATPLSPFSQAQTPVQVYAPESTSVAGSRAGLQPSIIVEPVENHSPLAFPIPLASTPKPAQEHQPQIAYASGVTQGPPGQAYVQSSSQAYIPAPVQTYPQSFSPFQPPASLQSPHTPVTGQPQQLYDVSAPKSSSPLPSHSQQHTQYPGRPPTVQPLTPPPTYPQQQQPAQYPPYPQQSPSPSQQQQHPPHQQPYLPSLQQQYLPHSQQQYHHQPTYCSPTPHPPEAPQQYQQPNYPGLALNGAGATVIPQQYSQHPQQSYFAAVPSPTVQSPIPQPVASQSPLQPQSRFVPPPPPPPLPPLHGQGVKDPSNQVTVAQPLQTPVPASAPSPIRPLTSLPSSAPITPSPPPPISAPISLQAVPDIISASTEAAVERTKKEGKDEAKPVVHAEAETVPLREAGGTQEGMDRDQTTQEETKEAVEEGQKQVQLLENIGEQEEGDRKEMEEDRHRFEEELRQQEEEDHERQKQEEKRKLEEEEQRRQEEERKKQEDEEERRQEEQQRRQEEERKRQEDEERRRQEEELRKEEERKRREQLEQKEAELRRREEELKRREEEERRRREEEHRRQEEERRRREEEERRRQEAERRRREEEERRRQEEERKRREEERRRKEEESRRQEEERRRREEEERRRQEEERKRREEERRRQEEERKRLEDERRKQEEARVQRERDEAERRRKAEEAAAERKWQEELARIRARAEQEAADAAFARAQMEAEEEERRRQEEADLALLRQAQEEAEREEILAQERRRQEEADMEVAKREQAHEEELERKRREERWKRMEETDRELARRLDMELNLGGESSSNQPRQRRSG